MTGRTVTRPRPWEYRVAQSRPAHPVQTSLQHGVGVDHPDIHEYVVELVVAVLLLVRVRQYYFRYYFIASDIVALSPFSGRRRRLHSRWLVRKKQSVVGQDYFFLLLLME